MEISRKEDYDPILLNYLDSIRPNLDKFNDPNFIFNGEYHSYTYKGKKLESVTTMLKKFKTPFDKKYWSGKKAKERGVDPSVILLEWEEKSNRSMDLGTRVHKFIEDFLSEGISDLDPEGDSEYRDRVFKFTKIYDKKIKYLLPVSSELRVFCEKWGIAGTIDQLFLLLDENKKIPYLIVFDWKSNGDFTHDLHPRGKYQFLLEPFESFYSNNLNEYSIQISTYRLIMREMGIETEGGFLCHIGPNGPAKIYKCLDFMDILEKYLNSNSKDIFSFE